mgnify:CR=1 FL=1
MIALTFADLFGGLVHALREAGFMFWDTLWALALGFLLSGMVQAFVKREAMRKHLGDHSPGAVARATGLGMVSSSCSYAATAMARALWSKGADFLSAMVFMFASTNLVIELGVVLFVLMGWQFAVGEFVGGFIMIVLLVLLGSFTLLTPKRPEVTGDAGGEGGEASSWRKLRGWADASGYAMADLTMLRKEMAIGYLIAGVLAAWVPATAWSHIFLTGHGIWSDIWSAIVGPFVAIISFVCSVGNVPMAAALWAGGIGFGGVISFIFADLITFPLLLIYVKMYGRAAMWRILVTFWVVMSLAGLLVQALFSGLGMIPTHRSMEQMVTGPSWNTTTFLNFAAIAALLVAWRLAKHPARLEGSRFAVDPVCGMQVEQAHAPATSQLHGQTFYFCAERCKERFDADPHRFAHGGAPEAMAAPEQGEATDPVCGMAVDMANPAATFTHEGTTYYFCNPGCTERFRADPQRYLEAERFEPMGGTIAMGTAIGRKPKVLPKAVDPVCGMEVDPANAAAEVSHEGVTYYFCNPGCAERFNAEPAAYL